MSEGTRNTAKQIALITRANREHSGASEMIMSRLNDIQKISERNSLGVKETRRAASRLLQLAATVEKALERVKEI